MMDEQCRERSHALDAEIRSRVAAELGYSAGPSRDRGTSEGAPTTEERAEDPIIDMTVDPLVAQTAEILESAERSGRADMPPPPPLVSDRSEIPPPPPPAPVTPSVPQDAGTSDRVGRKRP